MALNHGGLDERDWRRIDQLCASSPDGTPSLLQVLRIWQEEHGWLSPPALECFADRLQLPLAQVRAVAGFYRFLHLKPAGEFRLLFPNHIIEENAGMPALVQRLCERLGVMPGQTRADGRVSVDRCSCIGMSDQGLCALVNHRHVLTHLTNDRIDALAELINARVPVPSWPAAWFEINDNLRHCGPLLSRADDGSAGLQQALDLGPEASLQVIGDSGLRGRGGAGFPTARKWRFCREAAGTERVVVCNADEGEPGTFKDRVILTRQADQVFEGMTIAALVLGARRGFVYLRGEYRYLLDHLQDVLSARRKRGLLGAGILGRPGFDFDIDIHVGAGAYVCGEESALIESLEGKRGTPRIRPPFPVECGYQGKPTVVNNVETFLAAAWICANGSAAWRAAGTADSTGTKIHSIAGDCLLPGIYEFPMGTPVAQLLASCGAGEVSAVQVGGPAGTLLAPAEFGRSVAFEDVPSAGAFTVFDAGRNQFDTTRNLAAFFAHESCGFCTPCRVGTGLLSGKLDKITQGRGSLPDIELLVELEHLMHATTHCGLGAAACNHLRDALTKFRPHFEARCPWSEFEPDADMDRALEPARRWSGRADPDAHLENVT